MPDFSQLPFLLQLLDDDTETVRREVYAALAGFGVELPKGVAPYLQTLNEKKYQLLEGVWETLRETYFEQRWQQWLDEKDEYLALELALSALALRESKIADSDLSTQLDELTCRFHAWSNKTSILLLMRFLFRIEGFRSPDREYYHANNSNLVSVIERKEGLQISLSCLAILLGRRIGLELYGFNMPGHFMVMSPTGELDFQVYDVFSEGRPLHPNSIHQLSQALEIRPENLDGLRARPHEIILRVLRNIVKAHERTGNQAGAERFRLQLETLLGQIRSRGL